MTINSIHGDDNINHIVNSAMRSTIVAMRQEGLISSEQEDRFLNSHIAVFTTPEHKGFSDWMKRFFKQEEQIPLIVICETKTGE